MKRGIREVYGVLRCVKPVESTGDLEAQCLLRMRGGPTACWTSCRLDTWLLLQARLRRVSSLIEQIGVAHIGTAFPTLEHPPLFP